MTMNLEVQMILARSRNNVIGDGPDIPWNAKGEQKLFKSITTGCTLIMGRTTFEAIGRPLPNRTTIIMTRQADYVQEGCLIANSLVQALSLAEKLTNPIFIAGGGQVYEEALSFTDVLHITTIDVEAKGDVFFTFDEDNWEVKEETDFETNMKYTYRMLIRK